MTATTIDEVIEQLEQVIEETKREESPLGYFAALYHNVTVTVKEKLNTGYFEDDKRMEELDVVFANRYLLAYSDYREGKEITESWKSAFEAASDNSLIVLQHLLLGMNAHINLDLGIAAAEITNENTILNLESDFNKINEILSSLIDEVQRDLAEIWPTLLKVMKYYKKIDDFVVNFSMTIARDEAWKFAKSIVGKGELEKAELIIQRDSRIAELSKKLTNFSFSLKMIFKIIRIGERGSPSYRITALERLMNDKLAST